MRRDEWRSMLTPSGDIERSVVSPSGDVELKSVVWCRLMVKWRGGAWCRLVATWSGGAWCRLVVIWCGGEVVSPRGGRVVSPKGEGVVSPSGYMEVEEVVSAKERGGSGLATRQDGWTVGACFPRDGRTDQRQWDDEKLERGGFSYFWKSFVKRSSITSWELVTLIIFWIVQGFSSHVFFILKRENVTVIDFWPQQSLSYSL